MFEDVWYDDCSMLYCAELPTWCEAPLEDDDWEELLPEQIMQLLSWMERQCARLKRKTLPVRSIAHPNPLGYDGDGLIFYF